MSIFALILSIGLGFGLACLIFASLLAKSNDIGNSIGEASHYTAGVTFDRRQDQIKKSEKDTFAIGYCRVDEQLQKIEPASDRLVEQKEKMYNMADGIDDVTRNWERR